MKKQYPSKYTPEVVDLAKVKMIDNKLTIYWKSEIPTKIRSEFLIDIESEISIYLSCEEILEENVRRLLNGENTKIGEESIGLCEDYWKELSFYLERQFDV